MKVLIASLRRVLPLASYAAGYEFEDVIRDATNADLLEIRQSTHRLPPVTDKVAARLGLQVGRLPQFDRVAVEKDYDLFFLHVMSPSELRYLDGIDGWREHCRTRITWIEELWPPLLEHEDMLAPLRDFDHVFVGHSAAVAPLQKVIGRPCSFLPFGVDALRFCPYPDPPDRSIDVFSIGRRSADTHRAFYDRAVRDHKFHYIFDTSGRTELMESHVPHRFYTASVIMRSKFFLADRAKIDQPQQTQGSQVFGPRYFEGSAGGAILFGDPPDCDTFRAHLDWPDAIVPMAYGTEKPFEILDAFAADPARVARARIANVTGALERHDWIHRWQGILDTVGGSQSEAGRDRQARAAALANLVRQSA